MRRQEFISLRDIVYEKSGIYFFDNKAYLLENRLKDRLNEGVETDRFAGNHCLSERHAMTRITRRVFAQGAR